jgi:hypothetical protein
LKKIITTSSDNERQLKLRNIHYLGIRLFELVSRPSRHCKDAGNADG